MRAATVLEHCKVIGPGLKAIQMIVIRTGTMGSPPYQSSTGVPEGVLATMQVEVLAGVQFPWRRMEMVPLRLRQVESFLPMEAMWQPHL